MTPLLILGPIALAAAVFFFWCKRTMDGPDAPIVVVDRRTMHSAIRRVERALNADDLTRAYAGLTALTTWLGHEIVTGPRRYRAEYHQLKTRIDEARVNLGSAMTWAEAR